MRSARRSGWLAALLAVSMTLTACGGGAPRDMTVTIPEGASVKKAASILEDAGAIDSATAFELKARLKGGSIKPGEYAIKSGMSRGAVLSLIESGRTVQRFITIPEGMPSVLVHDRLMAEKRLTGTVPVPAEGSILPDTYAFANNEPRAAVVARMQAAMDKVFTELSARRSPRAVVQDRDEVMALASIIEKETSIAEERRTVAGVYTNRLRLGMKLQADPTIIYPITKGRPLGRRIRRSEIDAVNDYNTYAMVGLPAGPIANPGRASIAAALDPAETDYLYFVARGDGGHVFATTLDEHNRNVERWFAIRRERGELD